eukprot:27663-Amphidinium_carterae.1
MLTNVAEHVASAYCGLTSPDREGCMPCPALGLPTWRNMHHSATWTPTVATTKAREHEVQMNKKKRCESIKGSHVSLLVDILDNIDRVAPKRVVEVLVREEIEVGEVLVNTVNADDVIEVELEALVDVDAVQLVVLNVEVMNDVLVLGDVLADVDVVQLVAFDGEVLELVDVDLDVVREVAALEEIRGDVDEVKLVVLDVEAEDDVLALERDVDVLVINTHVIAKASTAITCVEEVDVGASCILNMYWTNSLQL